MSKMDALRAMREAKFEQRTSSAPTPRARAPKPIAPVDGPAADTVAEPEAAEALCGHRNMGGRTCTREHGHAAKSHRYS